MRVETLKTDLPMGMGADQPAPTPVSGSTPNSHENFLDTFEIADFEDLPEILNALQTDSRIQEESKEKEKTHKRVRWT